MSTENKMTAPVGGSTDYKRLDVEKIPTGFQLCTLYGMALLGTQETDFGPKNRIALMFEFPQQKRVFTEGGELKPSASYMEITYSMNEKAKLRILVHGMVKKMTDDEAKDFDVSSLLGKSYCATISHSADGKYANIDTLMMLNEQTKNLFSLPSIDAVEKVNEQFFFNTPQGYTSDNFKTLPNFIQDKIKASAEGKQHSLSGGTFAQNDSNGSATNSPAPKAKRKLIMIAKDFTYEQYATSWTDEQLVEAGHAKWEEQTTVAPPMPVAGPSAPSAPAPAPAPVAPPTPVAPAPVPAPISPPVKKLVMNDVNANIEDWYKEGWTDEMIVEQNYGYFQ
jgi:Fe-S cluster biosynthesis and repair protein YggX